MCLNKKYSKILKIHLWKKIKISTERICNNYRYTVEICKKIKIKIKKEKQKRKRKKGKLKKMNHDGNQALRRTYRFLYMLLKVL